MLETRSKVANASGAFLFPRTCPILYLSVQKRRLLRHHTQGSPACCFSVSSTESGVVAGVFSFLPNRQGSSSVSPRKLPLTCTIGGPTVQAQSNIPPTPQDGQDLTHLSGAELSALLDLITTQIEFHRDELCRLKPILHRLEANIPNQPFAEFISSLELGE